MRSIKFNEHCILAGNTVNGVIFVLTIIAVFCLPSFAGPQSLLDPYANIQAPDAKVQSKTIFAKKTAKKQNSNVEQNADNEDSNVSNQVAARPTKVKTSKVAKTQAIDQGGVASSSVSNNSGFLSGVKEIQHGCVTSIRAVGNGIVNGSKSAGAKVAAGTRGVCGGVVSASHKAAPRAVAKRESAPLDEKQPEVAETNPLPSKPIFRPLPGKPLDQVVAEKKAFKGKDKPLNEEQQSSVAHTFSSKLNFFSKHKKNQPARVATTNPNGLAQ
jgi:hypothetical protein